MDRLPGTKKDKSSYLKDVGFVEFPYLIADVLSRSLGHIEVRVMDGPGDGRRDIFSKFNGEGYLTQCKYHIDNNKSASSRELDEILIGLAKFKYTNAIFATNTKISPQGKREYLDNFPDYNLSYLEGTDIVEHILKDEILKRLWFDGESLGSVMNRIALPFFIRDNNSGMDIDLSNSLGEFKKDEVHYKFSPSVQNISEFSPYQPPNTEEFNVHKYFDCCVVELSGKVSYNSIDDLRNQVMQSIKLSVNNHDAFYAVRFGKPHFIDESSKSYYNKNRFYLPINPETYLLYNDEVVCENEWFTDSGCNWAKPKMIRTSQVGNYCKFNEELNLVFITEYKCTEYENLSRSIQSQIDAQKIIFEKSLFIGLKEEYRTHILTQDSDFKAVEFEYGPGGIMILYEHPMPMFYPVDMNLFREQLVHKEFEKLKSKLKSKAKKYGMEILGWEKGVKIMEFNGEDPLNSLKSVNYRYVDLLESFDKIPSPLNPSQRNMILRGEWSFQKGIESIEDILNEFIKFAEVIEDPYLKIVDIGYDDDNLKSDFVIVVYHIKNDQVSNLSCSDLLEQINSNIEKMIKATQDVLLRFIDDAKLETRKYYLEEFGLIL